MKMPDLLLLKSILTAIAFALALGAAFIALNLTGRIHLLKERRKLRNIHRRLGYSALSLFAFTGIVLCIALVGFQLVDLRVSAHIFLGILGLILLAVKVAAVRIFHKGYTSLVLIIGSALIAVLTGIFATSVLWYLVRAPW